MSLKLFSIPLVSFIFFSPFFCVYHMLENHYAEVHLGRDTASYVKSSFHLL